jgi:hypothetical protein
VAATSPRYLSESAFAEQTPYQARNERIRAENAGIPAAIFNLDGTSYTQNTASFPITRDYDWDIAAFESRTQLEHQQRGDDMPTDQELVDAKLATVEARSETRFVELNGKLDRIVDSIGGLAKEIGTVKADNRFTRLTITVAIVGSVIAGIAALWVTQANLLAAFQTGLSLHGEQTPPIKQQPSTQK